MNISPFLSTFHVEEKIDFVTCDNQKFKFDVVDVDTEKCINCKLYQSQLASLMTCIN